MRQSNVKTYKGYKIKITPKLKYFGETNDKTKTIKINKVKSKKEGGKGEVLNTILHEKAHIDKPNLKEKSVYRKVKKQMLRMTQKAKNRIYSKFS